MIAGIFLALVLGLWALWTARHAAEQYSVTGAWQWEHMGRWAALLVYLCAIALISLIFILLWRYLP